VPGIDFYSYETTAIAVNFSFPVRMQTSQKSNLPDSFEIFKNISLTLPEISPSFKTLPLVRDEQKLSLVTLRSFILDNPIL